MIRSVVYVVFLLLSAVVAEVDGNYFFSGEPELASKIFKENEGNNDDTDDHFLTVISDFIVFNDLIQITLAFSTIQFDAINTTLSSIRAPPV